MLAAPPSCKNDRLFATVRRFVRPVCWLDVAGAVYHRFPVPGFQAHELHHAPHPLTINVISLRLEVDYHFSLP